MRRWAPYVVCALAACGRIDFDELPTSFLPRACPWVTPTIGPVVYHPELSSTDHEFDPQLVTGDPLTMYFTRATATNGDTSVWVAHRSSETAMFDPPELVTELPLSNGLQLDASGHGYVVHEAVMHIYEVQRDTAGVLRDVRQLSELDLVAPLFDPHVMPDQLTMWFSGTVDAQDIFTATRSDTNAPWSSIDPFIYDSPDAEGGATLTGDGLAIVWASNSSSSPSDIYYAVRATTHDPWGPKTLLAPGVISTDQTDAEPSIREDGCELFFTRNKLTDVYDYDIYSVTLE
jgi:hypothetical protein